MSRRGDRAWEEFVAEHTSRDGEEEFHIDWRSAARALNVSDEPFADYDPEDGYREIDVEGLREAVRASFDNPEGAPPPLAMLTLRCQRCDRRLDALRVAATDWVLDRPTGMFLLGNPQVSSEVGALAGQGPLTYSCPCGRRDIQFSRARIGATLKRITPEKPQWVRGHDDEGYIVRPPTRRESIAG